jgi:GxxExxY protein
MSSPYIYQEETYQIIGCAMEVHRELGPGFLEPVYQESLEIEFGIQEVPNLREAPLPLEYKGRLLKKKYYADFTCFDKIIVELKALKALTPEHYAQALNHLKATGFRLALLINFGTKSLEYKRIIL